MKPHELKSMATIAIFFYYFPAILGFTLPRTAHRNRLHTSLSSPLFRPIPTTKTSLRAFYNDFDELGDDDDKTEDSKDLYASLRNRQSSLDSSRRQNMEAWRLPPVETMTFPLLNDWVRRVAMDTTAIGVTATSSYAIVGGASGSLYLFNLSAEAKTPEEVANNMMLGTLDKVHEDRGEEDFEGASDSARTRAIVALYGDYDGGGIIALAMRDDIVASAGREGGVLISRILSEGATDNSGKKNQLEALGKIPGLDCFASSLVFDQIGRLWVGSFDDGVVRAYDVDEEASDSFATYSEPKFSFKAKSGIMSLYLADEIGCGVAATESDGIVLFSTTDGSVLANWDPFTGSDEFARSVVIVQNDEAPRAPPMSVPDPLDSSQKVSLVSAASWSVIVGGSSGSLYQRSLNVGSLDGPISLKQPFDTFSPAQKIPDRIQHAGPVVALSSPGPQVFLSASQDGSIRVWDCSYQQPMADDGDMIDDFGRTKPNFLFAMAGFKAWLGSMIVLKSNHNILVTDGADNTVVALIFKKGADIS